MNRSLSTRLLVCCLLLCGYAAVSAETIETQAETVETRLLQSRLGIPVKATVIPVPAEALFGLYSNVQVASGSVWVTRTNKKAIRIDANTYQVDEVFRPRVDNSGFYDLLVDEGSLWHSTLMALKGPIGKRGDVYRVDPDTDQTIAVLAGVGVPFASGDGAVWAYNRRTGAVSEIDTKDNQLRTQFVTEPRPSSDQTHFTFGAGSIWQFAYERNVSLLKMVARTYYGGTFPDGVVRRIDPASGKVIAEIPIGPYLPTTQIRVLGGDVWVLGVRDNNGLLRDGGGMAFATRIDAQTNQVAAVIPFLIERCSDPLLQSPVIWNDGIWVSTGCHPDNGPIFGWGTGLQKIDLQTNSITDEIRWPKPGRIPLLATGEGALWALLAGRIVRFEF